jgi:2'-5' RNA ligase
MKDYYGFLFYLSQNDRKVLLPIISSLQKKYSNNVPFEPHITAHAALIETELEDTIKAVKMACLGKSAFFVEADGYGYQDNWTKILYIKIKENKIMTDVHSSIGNYLNSLDPRPYTPHISLMYKDELTDIERSKIISDLKIPKAFQITSVNVVAPGLPNNDWWDYTKWKVVYKHVL